MNWRPHRMRRVVSHEHITNRIVVHVQEEVGLYEIRVDGDDELDHSVTLHSGGGIVPLLFGQHIFTVPQCATLICGFLVLSLVQDCAYSTLIKTRLSMVGRACKVPQ